MEMILWMILSSSLLHVSHSLAPPRFLRTPNDQTGVQGGVASFICQATGDPRPMIVWNKNGKKVSSQRFEVIEFDDGSGSVLRNQLLRSPRDEAIYECLASNSVGETSTTARLTVLREDQLPLGFPTIDMGPQLKVVERTRTATMLCAASGIPDPDISWFKDFLPVNTNNNNGRIKQLRSGALQIEQSEVSDQGKYECVATNNVGIRYSAAANLYVREFLTVRRVPPRFSTPPPSDMEIMPGGSVNITCVAVGSPMPYVKWMLGEEDLTPEDEMPVGRNVLELTGVRQSANYTCVAMSSLGIIEAVAQITVKALPKAPGTPVASERTATTITLTWDSGNPKPVSYYVIQRKSKQSEDMYQEIDGVTTTRYSVGGLSPYSDYEFRVVAVNDIGRGPPSESIEAKTAEQAPSTAPRQVRGRMMSATTAVIHWEEPEEANGQIMGYRVYYTMDSSQHINLWEKQIVRLANFLTIQGLIPNKTYYIRVVAYTSVGDGPLSPDLQITANTGALQVQPTVKTTESDEVRLVGGTSHCAGRLEVKHQSEWRPAADRTSDWNLESSSVVCKQINCGSAVDSNWSPGSERQPVWWITSSCDGSESTLRECGTMQPGKSGDRLKVTCSDSPAIISVSVDPPGEVVEGSKVTLTCSSDANPPVNYTWYRDSNVSISTGPQLVMVNVQSADSGNYTCQATNTQRSSPHHLDVQYGPKNVFLEVSPPGDVVKGSSVTFTCSSSESNPPSQSYFIFKDKTIVAEKEIFTISNIQPSDSGTYNCKAMNNIATVSSPGVSVDLHPVRLVGGTSHCTGTLEVKHRNEWRPAADPSSNWNLTSSSVVCKQIDCGSAADTKWSHGSERQPVWWITSSCDGSESTLSECGTMQRGKSVDRLEVICSALFSKCGKPDPPDTVKVVRGRPSRPGDHPWQVSLQRRTKDSSEPFKHACGGVLIASCWVLTAGHCINSSKEMQVVVGRLDHTEQRENDQVIPVGKAIKHPDYRQSKLRDGSLSAVHNDVGEENKKSSSKLFDAHIPLISKQSCEGVYPDRLDDTMICAGDIERGVDACTGDSGGPLMCKQDGIHYVSGLVSWGTATCGEMNKPGVYTNVHMYVDWINKKMSGVEDYDYDYEPPENQP